MPIPLIALLLISASSGLAFAGEDDIDPKTISRIAFGSCLHQGQPAPIWSSIVKSEPDLFLFIGDNIYGDSEDMAVLKAKYDQLNAMPGYQQLKTACPIIPVWDDHDYGENDAGAEYPKKKESQQVFLKAFDEPKESPRWKREGVYLSRMYGPANRRVQIILLDTRYFRSNLVKRPAQGERADGVRGPYGQNLDRSATVLGQDQWEWLEVQLRKEADVRIIASSIQVLATEHHWEGWARFPHEQHRLLKLIDRTKANGVVFVTGDRHSAEISKLFRDPPPTDEYKRIVNDYPLYDVTSSSLNRPSAEWKNERNHLREGSLFGDENFGLITIDWSESDPVVTMEVLDIKGVPKIRSTLRISELQPIRGDDFILPEDLPE